MVSNGAGIPGNPTMDNWGGNNTSTPFSNNVKCPTSQNNNGGEECAPIPFLGHRFLSAAFVWLVQPETHGSTPAALRTALLANATNPNLDFTNTAKWPNVQVGDDKMQISIWLFHIGLAYSYVRADAAFSSSDRTTIDTWFSNAGYYWARNTDFMVRSQMNGNRNTQWDTSVALAQAYPSDSLGTTPESRGVTHYDCTNNVRGHLVGFETMNNRSAALIAMAALTSHLNGTLPNDAQTQRWAKMWFTEWLTYGTFADNMVNEYYRWSDTYAGPTGTPSQGWVYSSHQIGSMATVADIFARRGDTSLMEFTTSAGKTWSNNPPGFNANTTGGPKSLLQVLLRHATFVTNYTTGVPNWHGSDAIFGGGPHCGDSRYRLGPIDCLKWPNTCTTTQAYVYDTLYAMPNLYYRNATLRQTYLRQTAGALPYPSNPEAPIHAFAGPWLLMPSVLFQAGQLDGVLDPYGTLAPPAATCTVTAPTTFARYSTASDPLTTVQGTASAGTTSVAWECLTCSTTTGTATGTTSWSIASLAGLDVGDNLVTITPTDSEGPGTPCTLTIQYQTAPVTNDAELAYPFDTLTTTTPDATGHGHLGSVSGGVTSVTGFAGQGALCNGTTGSISTTGLLGLQTGDSVTLAARVKLASVPVTQSAEVVSLGDHVAIRLSGTGIVGFYYNGSTWTNLTGTWTPDTNWHHLAYTVAAQQQWVYLDGVPLAFGAAPTPANYSGLGQQVTVCRHGNGGAFYLGATVDDVQIYRRALTGADIAALENPSTPPTCLVTTPADDPYETDTTPLASFAGTATDDVDVDHVTWTNSLGGGGAATGAESWTVADIPLWSGSQVLTATAYDAEGQTGTCSVTVEYTPPPPPPSDVMGIYTGFTGAGVLRRR
jgi:hypothetical protein